MSYKKSAETRQRILDATKNLFLHNGYYATTIKDIARETGINHSAVYYYFKNKEAIARELFDTYTDRILLARRKALEKNPDLLTNIIFTYILTFRYLALNRVTQAVYYDMVQYSNYDRKNLERVTHTFFGTTRSLFEEYGVACSDRKITAYIITSDAFAKSLFKGILNGLLDFTFEEALDYFCRHMLLSEISVSEDDYRRTITDALALSEEFLLDEPENGF